MEAERKGATPEYPMDELSQARVDAVIAIQDAIMKALTAELSAHGRDPRKADIIASAICMSIHRLSDFDPRINYYIATMMAMGDPRDLLRDKK